MTPPQLFTAKLSDTRVHNPKFTHYFFELLEPNEFHFEAGQYVSLQVAERGDRRSYSVCSSPVLTHKFELLVDITPGGLGSQYMQSLQFGAEVKMLGPLGTFTVSNDPAETELVFIATGSGITPFRGMLLDQLQTKQDTRPITLYWGLRHEHEMFWQDEFMELSAQFPNFKFHPVISQPSNEWPLCRGRVTNCLSVHDIPSTGGYYLCGNAAMIKDTTALLAERGITPEHIHFEKFY
jgi:ferredoxin-NADP reductase